MKSAVKGASVEGMSIEVQCRKYTNLLPKKDLVLARTIYPFKLSIFGKVRILKELDSEAVLVSKTSLTSVDDEILGEAIYGHCEKVLPKPEVKHATASHKASFIKTRGHSYARVDAGTREVMQAIEGGA